MVVLTVNLPLAFIKTIEGLVGNKGLYPSRSELIRVAVREFLLNELADIKTEKNKKYGVISDENTVGEIKLDMDMANFIEINDKEGKKKIYRLIKKEVGK